MSKNSNRKTPESKHSRALRVLFRQDEYQKIYMEYKTSTMRSFAEYVRCALLGKKIGVYTRSRSLDELVQELVELRKEFSVLSQGFREQTQHIERVSSSALFNLWAEMLEQRYRQLLAKTEEIKEKINQLADQCWHE